MLNKLKDMFIFIKKMSPAILFLKHIFFYSTGSNQTEKDIDVLKSYISKAAESKSIEEFRGKVMVTVR